MDSLFNYPWLDEYCKSRPGAQADYKAEWGAFRYMLRGKMFAMRGADNTGRPVITLKLQPPEGEFLRGQYVDILPGYYMNKEHWNSVYLDGAVPDGILRDMVDKSHALLLASLPKKARALIESGGDGVSSL